MHIRAPAIVCAARHHGEVGVVVRLLTADHGLVGAYVAGGRGREMRPVLIPGNLVEAEIRARSAEALPFARLELVASRGPWLGEPLPAAGIAWVTALTATALPEQQAYPALHEALAALLDAICHAPSARGWVPGLLAYEALLLREMGYGSSFGAGIDGQRFVTPGGLGEGDWVRMIAIFDRLGEVLSRYLLADRRGDVMGTRALLRERLARIGGIS